MAKYSVWRAYQEQWDKDNIDPPGMVVDARDPSDAAIKFAEAKYLSSDEAAFIVRDDGSGQYFEIELAQVWEVDMLKPTTLDELCAP